MKKTKIIDCFDGKYAFLSNFYPSGIKGVDEANILYPTVEHAFQAMKTANINERLKIAAADTPGKAKRLGRKVSLRENWDLIKGKYMYTFVYIKFNQNPYLKDLLLQTGNATLVEGNTWHDNYWGNCTCEKCKNIKGQNHLGKILMHVREQLQEADASVKEMPYIVLEDGSYEHRIAVGDPGDWFEEGKCTDCGAKQGEFHDSGCDCERCPVCGLQLLTCDCWKEYSSEQNETSNIPYCGCCGAYLEEVWSPDALELTCPCCGSINDCSKMEV